MAFRTAFLSTILTLCVLTTRSYAQGGFGGGGGGGNPYSNGGDDDGGNLFSNSGGNNNGNSGFSFGGFNFSRVRVVLTAHAVLATLAFAFFLPIGGIIIRLGNFRGVWLVHAIFQGFAYILYIAAFGCGIWMISQRDSLLNNAHPIIGIVLFVLLFFQPFLGVLHHTLFKKYSRRVIWSYGHIWLGRIIITLGIINGGLGLHLASRMPIAPPSTGAIIAYGVVAGVMWLLYMLAVIVGERRRRRAPPAYSKGPDPVRGKTQYA